jgi:hypothetical protein
VSDSQLLEMIQKAVEKIIDDQRGEADNGCKKLLDQLKGLVRDGVKEAVKEYRDQPGNRIGYETSLGAFIIEQNPYASWEDIEFPNLPLDPKAENPWVRRSGVLRNYNALNPLPASEPIPGGLVVNFSYVDAPEFQDTRPYVKPPGEVPPDTTRPTPDETRFYPHNVVKAVRVKYLVYDRRFKKSSPFVAAQGRDRQTGYILVLYSGSDSN